jgi:hypothetical protein
MDDLAAYLQESGADPEEEFGPVTDFATQLGAQPEAESAAPDVGTWVWTADIFADERRLNEFGEQGWEVEKVNKRGMFVSHRDPEQPQRWEYRREVVTLKGRRALVEQLAPDGWEPCGAWFHYQYFKRPKAASVGPAADIDSPPPAPTGRLFFSRRFYLLVAVLGVFCVLVVIAVGLILTATTPADGGGFAVGVMVGMACAIAVFWLAKRRFEK